MVRICVGRLAGGARRRRLDRLGRHPPRLPLAQTASGLHRYAAPRSPLRASGLCLGPFAPRPAPPCFGLRPPCGVGRLRHPPRLPASAYRREGPPVARAGPSPACLASPRGRGGSDRLRSPALSACAWCRPCSSSGSLFGRPAVGGGLPPALRPARRLASARCPLPRPAGFAPAGLALAPPARGG